MALLVACNVQHMWGLPCRAACQMSSRLRETYCCKHFHAKAQIGSLVQTFSAKTPTESFSTPGCFQP